MNAYYETATQSVSDDTCIISTFFNVRLGGGRSTGDENNNVLLELKLLA